MPHYIHPEVCRAIQEKFAAENPEIYSRFDRLRQVLKVKLFNFEYRELYSTSIQNCSLFLYAEDNTEFELNFNVDIIMKSTFDIDFFSGKTKATSFYLHHIKKTIFKQDIIPTLDELLKIREEAAQLQALIPIPENKPIKKNKSKI